MTEVSRPRPQWLSVMLAMLVIVIAIAIAGCGDDDDDGGGGGGGAAETETTGAGNAGLQAAQEVVAEYSERPTEIPVTTPIGKPVPAGKTVVYINCGLPTCTFQYGIVKEAAGHLGWTAKSLRTTGQPESLKEVWNQIIQLKPDGVIYSGAQREPFDQQLREAEELGITVAAYSIPEPPTDGIQFVAATFEDQEATPKLLAAWVADDSEGSANTVLVNLGGFPVLDYFKETFHEYYQEYCSDCEVDDLNIPLSALGTDLTQRIVAYLRGHPDIEYVALTDNSLNSALPAALKTAGIEGIKVVGAAATPETLQQMSRGELPVMTSFPYYEILYSDIDAIARAAAGVEVLDALEAPLPYWYITQENQLSSDQAYPIVEDYQEQFKELWGK